MLDTPNKVSMAMFLAFRVSGPSCMNLADVLTKNPQKFSI